MLLEYRGGLKLPTLSIHEWTPSRNQKICSKTDGFFLNEERERPRHLLLYLFRTWNGSQGLNFKVFLLSEKAETLALSSYIFWALSHGSESWSFEIKNCQTLWDNSNMSWCHCINSAVSWFSLGIRSKGVGKFCCLLRNISVRTKFWAVSWKYKEIQSVCMVYAPLKLQVRWNAVSVQEKGDKARSVQDRGLKAGHSKPCSASLPAWTGVQ